MKGDGIGKEEMEEVRKVIDLIKQEINIGFEKEEGMVGGCD